MVSFILVMSMCVMMGVALGTLAKNKGYDYWRWFFIGLIPAFFPFALLWLIIKRPELKERDISEDKDSKFIRKMEEFDRTHK